jgi:hypothetical protein
MSQSPYPEVQSTTHTPLVQAGAAFGAPEHTVPHWPQCSRFVLVFVSQPLEWLPSQLPYGAVQEATRHSPVMHAGVAFASWHTLPHAPQFCTLVFRFVSHSTAGLPSHSPRPAAHVDTTHCALVHTIVPPLGLQSSRQLPQLPGSLCRFTSQPLLGCPSQSAYWPVQAPSTQLPAWQSGAACA